MKVTVLLHVLKSKKLVYYFTILYQNIKYQEVFLVTKLNFYLH